MEDIITLIKKAGKLKEIKRKGWVKIGIDDAESVACHSYRLTLLVMLIGDLLHLDTLKMMKMAVLHDIPEIITGDITPNEMDRQSKLELENESMKDLVGGIADKTYYNLWKEFTQCKSDEARLVWELDKLEMLIQTSEYEKKFGKELFKQFWEESEHIKHPLLTSMLTSIKKD